MGWFLRRMDWGRGRLGLWRGEASSDYCFSFFILQKELFLTKNCF